MGIEVVQRLSCVENEWAAGGSWFQYFYGKVEIDGSRSCDVRFTWMDTLPWFSLTRLTFFSLSSYPQTNRDPESYATSVYQCFLHLIYGFKKLLETSTPPPPLDMETAFLRGNLTLTNTSIFDQTAEGLVGPMGLLTLDAQGNGYE